MFKKAKNKKGFTLVELIVVIVIILILAAVLVPNVLKYVERARMANCQQEAASILTQVQADFAASQEAGQTGVQAFTKGEDGWGVVSGYTIGKVAIEVAAAPTGADHAAVQISESTAAEVKGAAAVYDITQLVYDNGTYTSTWTQAGGWVTTAKK